MAGRVTWTTPLAVADARRPLTAMAALASRGFRTALGREPAEDNGTRASLKRSGDGVYLPTEMVNVRATTSGEETSTSRAGGIGRSGSPGEGD